jgi:hypothetical protein
MNRFRDDVDPRCGLLIKEFLNNGQLSSLQREKEPKVLQTGSSQQCLVFSFVERLQWRKKCPGLEFCKVAEKTSVHQRPASLFSNENGISRPVLAFSTNRPNWTGFGNADYPR